MTRPNGIHHLAISTGDIKSQIEYFTDVLGCELVALYWMHGVEGFWHGFLRLNDSSSIAFVQGPRTPGIEPGLEPWKGAVLPLYYVRIVFREKKRTYNNAPRRGSAHLAPL